MVTRCEKCGQTILQTDATCWHCGAENKQRGQRRKPATAENGRGQLSTTTAVSAASAATVEDELEPVSLTAVFAYAVFTLISFFILLILARNLSAQPLFLLNPELERDPQWQTVTDSNLQFTLDIPQRWTYIENEGALPTGAFAERMTQYQANQTFLQLEKNIAGDVVPYSLIYKEDSSAYLLIVGSTGLQSVSNTQIMTLVEGSSWELLRMAEIEPTSEDFRVNVAHFLETEGRETRCITQFVAAAQERFILTGCAPQDNFPEFSDEISKMIALFQPLIYKN